MARMRRQIKMILDALTRAANLATVSISWLLAIYRTPLSEPFRRLLFNPVN